MTVSIRRMSLGAGFEYLMSSVVRGDGAGHRSAPLTAYYAKSGTPVGRFLGAGLVGLADGAGVPWASEVSEDALWNLLGMMSDPVTEQPLGRPPGRSPKSLVRRIAARVDALPDGLESADRAAAIGVIEAEERQREGSLARPVAAFDLTFSVPKSVSVVWALADPVTQEAIYRAHQEAIVIAMTWAERNVVFTRTGAGGAVQEPVRGVVAAAFDHWDSRAGDPHLHTHLVVANRVQAADGVWRSIDSKTLFRYTVALSELHEGVLQDILIDRLGYAWTEHPRRHSPVPRHDIAGVPVELMERFSQRAQAIETDKNRLVASFAASHGRQPTASEVLRLRQQATLQTRPDKHHRSLRELGAHWRERANDHTRGSPNTWAHALATRNDLPALTATTVPVEMLDQVAQLALTNVATKRATFRHANLLAEVHRLLHGARFTTPNDRLLAAEHTTTAAIDLAVRLNPSSVAVHRGTELYSTQAILDAEQRLLDAGQDRTAPALTDADLATIAGSDGVFGDDQAAAVTAIAMSGRVLDLLVGPAGTGKTTTVRALRTAWEHAYGPGSVIGLAPSATAAQVLADSLDIVTENTSKWLHEHTQNDVRQAHIDDLQRQLDACSTTGSVLARSLAKEIIRTERQRDRWTIHPGQLLILDEASLADTASLDTITAHIRDVGAKLLLVGDPFQLSPVDVGGALAMVANDRPDLPELREAHRFTHDWERAASLQLRHGDHAAIDTYTAHDRIHASDREHVLDIVYTAWRRDTDAGLTSLMIAADRDTVTALNHRARTDRILAGQVSTQGVAVATGVAGLGDRIITRRNDRTLGTTNGFVKNGDTWIITRLHPDGSVTAARDGGNAHSAQQLHLSVEYVRAHVELGYAITAHTAQGRTTDTAHAVISPAMTREALYVAATRGRASNTLNVITDYDTDDDTRHGPAATADEDAVLRGVLAGTGADTSAHAAAERAGLAGVSVADGLLEIAPQPVVRSADSEFNVATSHSLAL